MCGKQHTIAVSPDNERSVTERAVIRESRGCSLRHPCKIIAPRVRCDILVANPPDPFDRRIDAPPRPSFLGVLSRESRLLATAELRIPSLKSGAEIVIEDPHLQ